MFGRHRYVVSGLMPLHTSTQHGTISTLHCCSVLHQHTGHSTIGSSTAQLSSARSNFTDRLSFYISQSIWEIPPLPMMTPSVGSGTSRHSVPCGGGCAMLKVALYMRAAFCNENECLLGCRLTGPSPMCAKCQIGGTEDGGQSGNTASWTACPLPSHCRHSSLPVPSPDATPLVCRKQDGVLHDRIPHGPAA